MKIINLKSENFKRIKAVDITPDGNVVILAGRNEQGKSSIMDSIWAALTGGAATRSMPKPVRDGEKKATVSLDLGEIKVTRIWTDAGTSSIKVTNADGLQYSSPQAVLNGLLGKLTFDPLEFARMEPREQRAALLDLVELPFDLAEFDEERKVLQQGVTAASSLLKIKQAAVAGLNPVPDGTPDEEVSVSELMKRLTSERAVIAMNNKDRERLRGLETEVKGMDQSIRDRENEIERLKDEIESIRKGINETKTKRLSIVDAIRIHGPEVDALQDPDTSITEQAIRDSDKINRSVRDKKEAERIKAEADEAERNLQADKARLNEKDDMKRDALKAAKFPIDGLSFDDTGVMYKGIPFTQCSTSQRITVSVAMGMAMNPKLRVMFVRDGSFLDSENMDAIEKAAKDNDFQFWIERVDESGKTGFIIEDGTARAAENKEE